MQPKISFVMPTRDRDSLIGEAIQSIIEQSVQEWELIIVDDHSKPSDKTESIVAKFNDKRIRYYRLPDNFGQNIPSARNFGNALAHSPIIAVCDSDDLYSPDRAAITLDAFEHHNCDVFYGRYHRWDEATNVIFENKDKPIIPFDLETLKKYDFIPHGSSAYRTSIAYEFPYNSFMMRSQDYDLFSRLAMAKKKFYFSTAIIYTYRRHATNHTRMISRKPFDAFIRQSRGWEAYSVEAVEAIVSDPLRQSRRPAFSWTKILDRIKSML